MNKSFAILLALFLMLGTALPPAAAEDAVSSATVNITALPELKENQSAASLVIFFSTDDTVKAVAYTIAEALASDVFEIVPEVPYTKADIRWMNPLARCNKEKFGKKDVPVKGKVADFDAYDTVYIGFPIWYGCAPNVVNTFCAAYDWTGKKIGVFATSGGSGIGKTAEKLAPYVKGGEIVSAKLVKSSAEVEEIS